MAKMSKSTLLVIALVILGAGIFILLNTSGRQGSQTVTMDEVFSQTPSQKTAAAGGDPVTSPAIVTSPENGLEQGFTIQVYSFQDRTRADKAIENLKKAGYKPFMEVSQLGDKGTWYRVRVGGIESETQARTMLEEIRKNYNSGFIVKPPLQ